MALGFRVNQGTLAASGTQDVLQDINSDLLVTNTGSGDLYVVFHDSNTNTDSGQVHIPAGQTRNIPNSPIRKAGWFKLGSSAGTTWETAYWLYSE